jgi:plasmid stabilization system protein ParE
MCKVEWTEGALLAIAQIHAYISKDSRHNADNFINRLIDSTETQLTIAGIFSGRETPEFGNPNKREIIFEKYRVLYDVNEDGTLANRTQRGRFLWII